MKAVYLLSFMCLMYCIVSGTTGVGTRRRVKRELLDISLPSADTVSSAIDWIKKFINDAIATADVKIDNLTKWKVRINSMEVLDGDVKNKPRQIQSGYKSGWFAYQQPEHDGTEGFALLLLSTDMYCVLYWRVQHQLPLKERNALGVGCMPISYTCKSNLCLDDWDLEIEKSLADSSYVSDYLYFQEYHTTLSVIEHCNELVCIQGEMGVTHKTEISVEIIPRNVTDVAPSLNDTLTQEMIDDSTDEKYFIEIGKPRKPRKKDRLGGAAVAAIVLGVVLGLVMIAGFVFVVYKKLRNAQD